MKDEFVLLLQNLKLELIDFRLQIAIGRMVALERLQAECGAREELDHAVMQIAGQGQTRSGLGALLDCHHQRMPFDLPGDVGADLSREIYMVDGQIWNSLQKKLAFPGAGPDWNGYALLQFKGGGGLLPDDRAGAVAAEIALFVAGQRPILAHVVKKGLSPPLLQRLRRKSRKVDTAILRDEHVRLVALLFAPHEDTSPRFKAVGDGNQTRLKGRFVDARIREYILAARVNSRPPLVHAEPDQNERKDHEMAGADDERLAPQLRGRTGHEQSREQVQQRREARSQPVSRQPQRMAAASRTNMKKVKYGLV